MKLRVCLVAAGLLVLAGVDDASAFGFNETCRRDVTARGKVQGAFFAAQRAAIEAWQSKVAKSQGRGFANWYYSADRTIDCKWDRSGRRIQCTAIAGPCGRVR